ncbi:hypothetical protein [Accumulibacter sp.]|uniref:hypothetical protein n=1 Tax=Accumulibacter sp. TaxID=2053492 RepID=UPI00260025BE|nr:hypothetical protein [Accumulibacter sp.]MCM8624387.1 hypothetical protein [Accumulibacter sp.]
MSAVLHGGQSFEKLLQSIHVRVKGAEMPGETLVLAERDVLVAEDRNEVVGWSGDFRPVARASRRV